MSNSTKKLTNDEYIKRFNAKSKGRYILLDIYKNSRTDITIKHIKCGTEYKVNPRSFIRDNFHCKVCSNKVSNTEKFKEKLEKIYGNKMELLTSYVNARTTVKVLHKPCGYIREVLPSTILRYECPVCSKNLKKTTDQFKKEVYELTEDEYEVLGEYIGVDKYTKMKHNKCGHIYKVKPGSFLNHGSRCPKCNESKGEKRITKYLESYNVKFKPQYTFKDLKGKRKASLRFDFGILNSDGNLKCLIEYDGELHYIKTNFCNLEYVQKHDEIKNDYCKKNKIKLLRIPYWDFDNIEKILAKAL